MSQKDEQHQSVTTSTPVQRPVRERVGVYAQSTDARAALASIREAERAGVAQFWLSIGAAGFADILSVFTAAATQTERIKLGTAVIPTYTRHPLVMAQQALALHDLAPGRLRLGIGPGSRMYLEHNYGLKQLTPLAHLREYLEVLRAVLWEGSVDYHGRFFQVADSLSRTAQVPLMISALGLKAFRLAGEVADGAVPSMCPLPYLLEQALPALRAGAEARKRPAPPVIAMFPVALCTDEAAVLAVMRKQLRSLVQYATHYARIFEQVGFEKAVNGDEADLDALARTLVISGDAATVRDRIQALLASGLDELILSPLAIVDGAKEQRQLLELVGSL